SMCLPNVTGQLPEKNSICIRAARRGGSPVRSLFFQPIWRAGTALPQLRFSAMRNEVSDRQNGTSRKDSMAL
ncbi:hypothetical protein, partial [Pseudomonas viridiflava]|uniref:hypothetical protein n=1 Tax=Pseudomonas viridiflava TaxID=33069 RepID=UPI00197F31C8